MNPVRARLLGAGVSCAVLLGILAPPCAADPQEAPRVPPRKGKSETISLFNGKTLDGWQGANGLWSVDDGAIVGKSGKPLKTSAFLFSRDKYGDFRLTGSVRVVQNGKNPHAGIAFWGRLDAEKGDRSGYVGPVLALPADSALWDLNRRGNLKVSGDHARQVFRSTGWNDFEILAQGNQVRVVLNGTQVLNWRDPEPGLIADGPIGLQLPASAVPQEAHFKNLVLTTFPEPHLGTLAPH